MKSLHFGTQSNHYSGRKIFDRIGLCSLPNGGAIQNETFAVGLQIPNAKLNKNNQRCILLRVAEIPTNISRSWNRC